MIYSSLFFIYAFLPISILVFNIVPKKSCDAVMLFLSMVFCGFYGTAFLVFMVAYTLINYLTGLLTDAMKKSGTSLEAIPLTVGIILNIFIMFVFRADFMSWLKIKAGFHEDFFPFGISFIILNTIGYLIDIYCGRLRAEKNLVTFGIYVMMFPRLVMGPMLRYRTFQKINRNRITGLSEIGKGLSIFIKGLAKKVLAADNLYMLYTAVNGIERNELSFVNSWLGISAYVLCLYFTLSGFSDMSTGIGYCFGYRFPNSFNYPLFSSRMQYFAAKWHIQPVRWFRKYIGTPIYKTAPNDWVRRIAFVFAWGLVGFWYGFSANSTLWGILIGISILAENFIVSKRTLRATGIIYSSLLVFVIMTFLAGESVTDSLRYLWAMFGGNRILADTSSVYLIRSYIVILLITMYASTNLFRNMMLRSGRLKLRAAVSAFTPVVSAFMLIICTAIMSLSGNTEILLLKL